MWMRHVTRMNESCHTYEWVMSHIWMSRVTHVNASCHTYEWVMSHIWMSHVTHINESCHTCECVMSHIWMSHVTHMNESCHTYEWVMSPSLRCCNAACACSSSSVTHTNEACHTCEWGMSHICHTYECVMSHVWMRHVTRMNKSIFELYSHFLQQILCWSDLRECVPAAQQHKEFTMCRLSRYQEILYIHMSM